MTDFRTTGSSFHFRLSVLKIMASLERSKGVVSSVPLPRKLLPYAFPPEMGFGTNWKVVNNICRFWISI